MHVKSHVQGIENVVFAVKRNSKGKSAELVASLIHGCMVTGAAGQYVSSCPHLSPHASRHPFAPPPLEEAKKESREDGGLNSWLLKASKPHVSPNCHRRQITSKTTLLFVDISLPSSVLVLRRLCTLICPQWCQALHHVEWGDKCGLEETYWPAAKVFWPPYHSKETGNVSFTYLWHFRRL